MKLLATIFLSLLMLTSFGISKSEAFSGPEQKMDTIHVIRADTQPPPSKAPASNFTGDVSVARLFPANDQMSISGGYVSFQPGARTAWHIHPRGQMLIITEGSGRVQQWGGPIIEVKKGDVVWFPPGVKHWHGAAPNVGMTHISLAEIYEGRSTDWLEQVSDAQYNGK
ncbi:MAG: (R)-mandelonitrile lyase [Sporomusa sp.]